MNPGQYQPGQILPGTVYRVVRHLATGGMGSVYDVEDVTVEKRYVLKTLHPNLVAREDLALRMRDEAKSLARLQHPNIVDVVTAGVTTDAQRMPFYVMERLIGQNLRVVLGKTGALHVPHAYRIAIDVADALEHAHENNIVHRDVKPENIFLHRNANGTTTTKLLDFGIVRLLDRKASHTHGKFVGTLRYASPEQIAGRKVGPATDIYSLGIVLFEMLCGRGPFDDAGDAYAIGAAHANVPAPPLSRFTRAVPEVERLVASALAKDPNERPRDCFAFASELRRILREEEANPQSATAVNLLSAAAPSTQGLSANAGGTNGATMGGMPPPSAVMAEPPPPALEPARDEGGATGVSPVAPTLAAERASYSPVAPRREVDRSAPTREMAYIHATQRLAQNDTRMELGKFDDDDVRAAMGESVSLVVPPIVRAGSNASASDEAQNLVFAPMQAATGTGPVAGEAPTRPPERGAYILVGVAAVLAIAMVGGAFLAVRQPWQDQGEDATGGVEVRAVPTTSPSPKPVVSPGPSVRASAPPPATTTTPSVVPVVPAAAPSGSAPRSPSVQRRGPVVVTEKPPALAAPVPPLSRPHRAAQGSRETKPPSPSSGPTKDVPFDP